MHRSDSANRSYIPLTTFTQEMYDMSRKRAFPVASVLAVATVAFIIRSAPATGVPAGSLDDATIVADFDAANTSDIETGALAARMGSTKTIRDFGAMLDKKISD